MPMRKVFLLSFSFLRLSSFFLLSFFSSRCLVSPDDLLSEDKYGEFEVPYADLFLDEATQAADPTKLAMPLIMLRSWD